jgi:hypothetical protein
LPRAALKQSLPGSPVSETIDVLMATRPNFFSSLQLPEGDSDERQKLLAARKELEGPVARGPMKPGDKMHWIYVWIIQNGEDMQGDTWAAAAYGEYPKEEHSNSSEERPPKEGDEWDVATEMKYPGDDFKEGPAIATSMALIERKDESPEVYWWTEAVVLQKRKSPAT